MYAAEVDETRDPGVGNVRVEAARVHAWVQVRAVAVSAAIERGFEQTVLWTEIVLRRQPKGVAHSVHFLAAVAEAIWVVEERAMEVEYEQGVAWRADQKPHRIPEILLKRAWGVEEEPPRSAE